MEAGSESHDEDEDNNEDSHEGEEDVLEEDDAGRRNFRFVEGPIFTNILLAECLSLLFLELFD